MKTRILMTSSAIILGIMGILLTFIPDEILGYFNSEMNKSLVLVMQIIGALYFSFGMLNWMAKGSIIGGIYNRPIIVANLTHFLIAGLALAKGLFSKPVLPVLFIFMTCIYVIFAISFGILMFNSPVKEQKKD